MSYLGQPEWGSRSAGSDGNSGLTRNRLSGKRSVLQRYIQGPAVDSNQVLLQHDDSEGRTHCALYSTSMTRLIWCTLWNKSATSSGVRSRSLGTTRVGTTRTSGVRSKGNQPYILGPDRQPHLFRAAVRGCESRSHSDARPGTMGLRLTSAKLSLDCDWKKTWLATLKVENRSVESAIDGSGEG